MPLFEYRCAECGAVFEHLARSAGEKPGACPKCGAKKAEKQFSTFAARQAPEAGLPSCAGSSCSTGTCATGACPFSAS
ncbi:MAG: zinc ribbon domain-containing protein [Kiritimatiellae bacterium]|nr:zinc ribbon domain-containing protein [Kiritimatiellia bacterium]